MYVYVLYNILYNQCSISIKGTTNFHHQKFSRKIFLSYLRLLLEHLFCNLFLFYLYTQNNTHILTRTRTQISLLRYFCSTDTVLLNIHLFSQPAKLYLCVDYRVLFLHNFCTWWLIKTPIFSSFTLFSVEFLIWFTLNTSKRLPFVWLRWYSAVNLYFFTFITISSSLYL